MNAEERDAIRKRCEAATPGEWRQGIEGNIRAYGPDGRGDDSGCVATFVRRKDLAFIVNARSDIPALLSALTEAEARAEVLRKLVAEVIRAAEGDIRTSPGPSEILAESDWYVRARAALSKEPSDHA